jgi:putative nucleotidyltransferase with HDIG domain
MSDYKKLLDNDHPLLTKFKDVAPGSNKHCQNTSVLCESVAMELGLDVDLMKLVGRFHDIGKINNPLHFSENQSSKENIHDELEPNISYQLITRHVSDGVMILFQNDFPTEAIKIISEHHGDSILKQFHQKDPKAPEDNYRYKSRKPTTTEAVVLMIVDSVEATSRAMFIKKSENEDNGDFINRVIDETVERLDDDDQLDKVLHGDIKKIKRILAKELDSIYHKRVSYSEEDLEENGKKENK